MCWRARPDHLYSITCGSWRPVLYTPKYCTLTSHHWEVQVPLATRCMLYSFEKICMMSRSFPITQTIAMTSSQMAALYCNDYVWAGMLLVGTKTSFCSQLPSISPLLLSWSFPRVINFKFPLWSHQKYCIDVTPHSIIWLFIDYSNERWLYYYSLPHLYIYFKVGRVYCLYLGVKSVKIINLWFLRPLCNQNMSLQSTLSKAD